MSGTFHAQLSMTWCISTVPQQQPPVPEGDRATRDSSVSHWNYEVTRVGIPGGGWGDMRPLDSRRENDDRPSLGVSGWGNWPMPISAIAVHVGIPGGEFPCAGTTKSEKENRSSPPHDAPLIDVHPPFPLPNAKGVVPYSPGLRRQRRYPGYGGRRSYQPQSGCAEGSNGWHAHSPFAFIRIHSRSPPSPSPTVRTIRAWATTPGNGPLKQPKGCKPNIILPSIRNAPDVQMGRPPTGQRPDLCEPKPAAWVNRKKKQHALKGQTTLPPGASSKAMSDSLMRVDAKAAWDAPSALLYILGLFPRALP